MLDVAAQYFEEIFLDWKIQNNNKKEAERFLLTAASYSHSTNVVQHSIQYALWTHVCGAAEAPEGQAWKWTASKSSLAKVL